MIVGMKVVAITGASAGIGRAIAEHAARAGHAVVVSARRADRLDALAASITAAGGRALAVPADVTHDADMTRLVERAVAVFGRLDVMCANAGVGFHDRFEDTPAAAMRHLVDVNVLGTCYAAQAALRQFRAQGAGHLIVTSSVVGRRGIPGSALYSATKAAEVGLVEAIRAETFGTAIHASVVYPISTATEFHETIRRDYGIEYRGRGPKQSVDVVAAAIVACIARPRPEVYPYRLAKWLGVLSVIAPGWADRLVQRYARERTR